ncbi:MAG: site-specific integrase, partial [Chloroflexia bacterium]
EARTLRIRRQLSKQRVFSEPKTSSSRRVIHMSRATTEALRAHRVRQAEARLACRMWVDEDLVFCTTRGLPEPGGATLSPRNVAREFKALLRAAGLQPIRLHDCRHTAATLMLMAGANLREVADHLGHADVTMTLRVYAHVLPEVRGACPTG